MRKIRKFALILIISNLLFGSDKVCSLFPSSLYSFKNIQNSAKVCGTNIIYSDALNTFNGECYTDEYCSDIAKCNMNAYNGDKYNPNLLSSNGSNTPLCNNYSCELNETNYNSYSYNSAKNITFKATKPCPYDSNKKCMTFKDLTLQNGDFELTFYPGDYYFNTLNLNSHTTIKLKGDGVVRIFINNGDFKIKGNINKGTILNPGNSHNLFIFTKGNVLVDSASIVKAFIYTKGDFNNNVGNNFKLYGAITSEGNINVNNGTYVYTGKKGGIFYNCNNSNVSSDTSDICREDIIESGCVDMPMGCSGGYNCKKTIPIKNTTNTPLENVKVYYDESGVGGTIFDDCGVDPSGSCQTITNIQIGSIKYLNKATEFSFDNNVTGSDNDVWVKDTGGICLKDDNFYVTYVKNGVLHQGKLSKCIDNKFDAYDNDKDVDNRVITTKIVNKDFNLTIAHIVDGKLTNFTGTVCVRIESNEYNSSWHKLYFNNESKKNESFKGIDRAIKKADVYILSKQNVNENCPLSDANVSYSSDNFAVRPYKFIIVAGKKHKAGEEFNLTIKALDYENNIVSNFNYDYNKSDIGLVIKDNKNCNVSYDIDSNLSFVNGEANLSLKYLEVGDINISVGEKYNEYAKVDEDDTADKYRFIKNGDIDNILVIPYRFDVNANYQNYKGLSFTYLSKNLDMNSTINLNIKALNKEENITKNYSNECYAKDVDVNISHSGVNSNEIDKILFKVDNENENNISSLKTIEFNISKNYFSNGEANNSVYINFDRKPNNPINEFNFTIKDINVSNIDNVKGNLVLSQDANFRYGFLKIDDLTSYNKDINTTITYYYYKNDNWLINKEHNSSDFGDVKDYMPKNNISLSLGEIKKGKESVKISTTHALPYSAKIHLAIPSYLWYHPLAKEYKAPSNTNTDCLTHPCFKITFLKSGSGWTGLGNSNSKYNENNKTVRVKLKKETNATIHKFNKLNW